MSAATAERSGPGLAGAGLSLSGLRASLRTGAARGVIEFRQTFTNAQDLLGFLLPAVIFTVVMLFMRGAKVPGMSFSLGSLTLPSIVGAGVGFSGLITTAQLLTVEREDGTLLRAKAIPNGMAGYLIGKIVQVSAMVLMGVTIQLIAGVCTMPGLALDRVGNWFGLVGLLVLGLIATLPIGAVIGSVFANPRNVQLTMFPIMAVVAASGVFYPITHLPGWLQVVGQVFPVYWLGLGTRSMLLPPELSAAEIDHSWRHLETVGVLGAWAVLGLVLAPIVLRRMARRESGSRMAAYREKRMQSVN